MAFTIGGLLITQIRLIRASPISPQSNTAQYKQIRLLPPISSFTLDWRVFDYAGAFEINSRFGLKL